MIIRASRLQQKQKQIKFPIKTNREQNQTQYYFPVLLLLGLQFDFFLFLLGKFANCSSIVAQLGIIGCQDCFKFIWVVSNPYQNFIIIQVYQFSFTTNKLQFHYTLLHHNIFSKITYCLNNCLPTAMNDNDSDNDQGFVPTKVQIKSENKANKNNKNDQQAGRPTDFQGRYIFGEGLLRKQPVEAYARFSTYSNAYLNFSHNNKSFLESQVKQEEQNKQKTLLENPKAEKSVLSNKKITEDNKTVQKTEKPRQGNKIIEIASHPYDKYIRGDNYVLVYSRYRDKVHKICPQSDDFSQNQVNLSKVLAKYDSDHYSILKPFQYLNNEQRKQSFSKKIRMNQDHQERNKRIQDEYYNEISKTNRQKTQTRSIRIHSNQSNTVLHRQPVDKNAPAMQGADDVRISHNSMPGNSNDHLQFDSKFQCGNLLYAFKNKTTQHYILFIHNDTNSNGYNQWFYFSVRNMSTKVSYKFSIVNLRKRHSLFKQGMKISVFSLMQAQKSQCGWARAGTNIKYQKSPKKKYSDKKFKFYSLSFQLQFLHSNDEVRIAMNIPYSYSRLIHHLRICKDLATKQQQNQHNGPNHMRWQMATVGHSIANNAVPYLTVSRNPQELKTETEQQNGFQNKQKTVQVSAQNNIRKKAIIILSRQHPGQTWSSFMMEQMLYAFAECKNSTKPNEGLNWLLQNYTFKIFPMVNVDGVIYGNFRCDIAGFDLNRNWRNPDKNLHPQIYAIKNEIEKIASQYQIECVLDLHGHSKQYNTFSYACKNNQISARVLSLIISEINPLFHFPFCTFGLSKYKQTTARAIMYKLTGNENILTIQNSFYGAKIEDKFVQYDPSVIRQLSVSILNGVYYYLSNSPHRVQCESKIQKNILQYLEYEKIGEGPTNVDSGSQSEPYVDQISIKDKIKKILPKSFKQIELQLEQQQKVMKKKHSVKKKQNTKKMSEHKQYKTLNPSALKKIEQSNQKDTQPQQIQVQTFIQRTSLTQYKRNSKQLKKQPVVDTSNSQQSNRQMRLSVQHDKTIVRSDFMGKIGQVGLPFYIRQKTTLVPIKLKNDSLQIFKDAYNATKNYSNESNLRKTMNKPGGKKVKIANSMHNDSQQFPLLCVLSEEKKKQSQMQRTHAIGIFNLQRQKQMVSSSLPPKMHPSLHVQKLQSLKRNIKTKNSSLSEHHQLRNETPHDSQIRHTQLKSKNKDATLISKIWRQNFARYGKDLNVFFGGMKS